MKIKTKLLLLFLVAVIAPLAAIVAFIDYSTSSNVEKSAFATLAGQADAVAVMLRSKLESEGLEAVMAFDRKRLAELAAAAVGNEKAEKELAAAFEGIVEENPDILRVAIAKDGSFFASSDRLWLESAPKVPEEIQFGSERVRYGFGKNASGRAVSVLIYDNEGKFPDGAAMVWRVEYDFTKTMGELRAMAGARKTEHVSLVGADAAGNLDYLTPPPFDAENKIALPNKAAFLADVVKYGETDREDDYRRRVFAVAKHVEKIGVWVVVRVGRDEMFADAVGARQRLFSLFALAAALFALLVRYFAGVSVRPIKRLVGAADEFMRYKVFRPVPVATKDEIGELTAVFNKMASELHLAHVELEKKVKEQTESLDKKIAELERINKVMVDREKKMREMKQKMEELKQGTPK